MVLWQTARFEGGAKNQLKICSVRERGSFRGSQLMPLCEIIAHTIALHPFPLSQSVPMRREFDQPMDREALSSQINKILRSESLAGKDQLLKLLEILFAHIDAPTSLKPGGIISELWPEEVKTKRPADVATEINRLRKVLKTYYETEGQADSILVTLPNRSATALDGTKEKRWIAVETAAANEKPVLPTPLPVPQAKPHKLLWMVIAASGLCVVAAVGILFASRDNRPAVGRLDGPSLIILNGEGKELWHKTFPNGFWPFYYEQGLEQRIWIGDLNGDGHIEVLFLYHPGGEPFSHSTTLICFSSRGEEKWRWTPGRNLPELHDTPPVYLTFGFGVLKPDQSGHRRIVLSSQNQPFYPDQIAIIGSNGKTVSEYWHSGILNHLALADLDGDGRDEIIVTGISNGYDQATLIVLDPDKVFGASRELARPDVQLHGMGDAQERIRLLFPRSDINKVLSEYNAGLAMTIDNGRIRFDVSECSLTPNCDIVYEFDAQFHLRAVTPSDPFKSAHKEFYLNRRDDHLFGPKEEEEFQKIRCLSGCKSEFVPVQLD